MNWSITRLFQEAIRDREQCMEWCKNRGLLAKEMKCSEGHTMVSAVYKNKASHVWKKYRCSRRHTHGKMEHCSAMNNSIFSATKSKLPPEKALLLLLCFANEFSVKLAQKEASYPDVTSNTTVTNWYDMCRNLILSYVVKEQLNKGPIGGDGRTVEVGEFRITKQKFNFGNFVENSILIAFIDRNSKDCRFEILNGNEIMVERFVDVIKNYVAPGTTVVNENYNTLTKFDDDRHYMVDQIAGAHNIVSTAERFVEHLFRQKCQRNNTEPFEALLNIITKSFKVNSSSTVSQCPPAPASPSYINNMNETVDEDQPSVDTEVVYEEIVYDDSLYAEIEVRCESD